MDHELHHELQPKPVQHYRDEARALLHAVRSGDAAETQRGRAALGDRLDDRFVLADALHVVALEHGYRSWPAFKHSTEQEKVDGVRPAFRVGAFGQETYDGWAQRLLTAARDGDSDALLRLRQHVPRLAIETDDAIAARATDADAKVCLAREYGFRTWVELAEGTDRARDTHYSGLPAELPWKQAEAAIHDGDTQGLRALLQRHPGLEHEDPGMTLIVAAAQPEAGDVPREVVDALIESGSALDDALAIAACFNKPDMAGWLLDAGADPHESSGVSPLQSAAYHGSREAADVLVARTGIVPDVFYLAAAAGDVSRMTRWFNPDGQLLAQAFDDRPNFTDVGWPGRAVREDLEDVLAEALALAAHLGRTEACVFLLDHGTDPTRAPLYGITPLHFAAQGRRRATAELLVARGAPLDARDGLNDDTPFDWTRRDPAWTALLLSGGKVS